MRKIKYSLAFLLLWTLTIAVMFGSCGSDLPVVPQHSEQSLNNSLANTIKTPPHRQVSLNLAQEEARVEESAPPVFACSLIDFSGSTAYYKVFPPSASDIRPVLDVIDRQGGTFATGAIHARPSDPLLRITILPPEPLPEGEDPDADVFTRSRQRKAYRKALPEWEAREAQRRRVNKALIDAFTVKFEAFLQREHDPGGSILWDSVKRCEAMLLEDPHEWTRDDRPPPLRYLALNTDGRGTPGRSGYSPLHQSIEVIAISGVQGLGDLAQIPGVKYFESAGAGFRFIASTASAGGVK